MSWCAEGFISFVRRHSRQKTPQFIVLIYAHKSIYKPFEFLIMPFKSVSPINNDALTLRAAQRVDRYSNNLYDICRGILRYMYGYFMIFSRVFYDIYTDIL